MDVVKRTKVTITFELDDVELLALAKLKNLTATHPMRRQVAREVIEGWVQFHIDTTVDAFKTDMEEKWARIQADLNKGKEAGNRGKETA